MDEKSLFIKLEKHKEINDLLKEIEKTKEQTKQKIDFMKEIMNKEKEILETFEDSLKKIDANMEDAKNLINQE